ncbi:hypothetical protein H5410_040584 [Solanum commersonii]|uniref:Uncharacterized protein n=1 Tax=Solanum commersonii TaxID=4109 RepID=A0A9J5XSY6_SOLCO|nr:hypothetical protein H5410_040584 [Solanum commersonii]
MEKHFFTSPTQTLLMNSYNLPILGYQGKAPHYARPSYHGKHTLMQVQATQGRATMPTLMQATMNSIPEMLIQATMKSILAMLTQANLRRVWFLNPKLL